MVANNFPLKIGLFGIGLEAYWEQFEGLQKRLAGYVDVVAGRLKTYGAGYITNGFGTDINMFEAG